MRTQPTSHALLAALTIGALIALAGCSKQAPEPESQPAANESVEFVPEPAEPEKAPEPEVVQEAPPPEPKVPPPHEISDEAQMQHDAEATGMTARIDRSGDAGGQDGGNAP